MIGGAFSWRVPSNSLHESLLLKNFLCDIYKQYANMISIGPKDDLKEDSV